MHEYVFGTWGGKGLGSEVASAVVSPTNIAGNAVGATQTAATAIMQKQTATRLEAAEQRISSGAARTVRINANMELYNANPNKGRPRLRLRISELPVEVLTPIAEEEAWRAGARGAVQSTKWVRPSSAQARAAGVLAAETGWGRSLGWATGKVGGGVLAFAPSLGLDAYNNMKFEVDARGARHLKSFDTTQFAVDSAKSQSGNAAGVLAGVAATEATLAVAEFAVGSVVVVAGWPVLLIALGAGIVAQVVWNEAGGAAWAERHAKAALK